jgi:hypothetical protein
MLPGLLAAIEQHVQRGRTILRSLRQHKTKPTAVRSAVDGVQDIVESLRTDMQDLLTEIEASLRIVPVATEAVG